MMTWRVLNFGDVLSKTLESSLFKKISVNTNDDSLPGIRKKCQTFQAKKFYKPKNNEKIIEPKSKIVQIMDLNILYT